MRLVVQRVNEASVTIDGECTGKIGKGFLVLLGVAETDTAAIADKLVKKLVSLRIFDDEDGKTNLNLEAVGGELLIVSQFTLYADCKKGNRPSFIKAGGPVVEHGEFGADMKVSLINDGPFTIVLDSEEIC